jgi:hypothetical protein
MSLFWQLVVTVWLGAHPVTFAAPRLYPTMHGEDCRAAGEVLAHRMKPDAPKMSFECVQTDKRDA